MEVELCTTTNMLRFITVHSSLQLAENKILRVGRNQKHANTMAHTESSPVKYMYKAMQNAL